MNVYPEKVCPWRAGVGVLGAAEVAGPSPGCRVYSAWQAGRWESVLDPPLSLRSHAVPACS